MIHQHTFELYGGPINTRNVTFRGTLLWSWDEKKQQLEKNLTLVEFPGFDPVRPGYILKATLYDFTTTEVITIGGKSRQRHLVRAQVIATATKIQDGTVKVIDKLTGGFSQPQYLQLDIGAPFGEINETVLESIVADGSDNDIEGDEEVVFLERATEPRESEAIRVFQDKV